MVPGIFPFGCFTISFTLFPSSRAEDYSLSTSCINWLNEFAELHDNALEKELRHLRLHHPNATIIYADFSSVAWRKSSTQQINQVCEGIPLLHAAETAPCTILTFELSTGRRRWDSIHGHGRPLSQACPFIQPTFGSKTDDDASYFTASWSQIQSRIHINRLNLLI